MENLIFHAVSLTGTRDNGSTEVNTTAEEDEPEHQEYDVEIFIDIVRGEYCILDTSCRAYKEVTKKIGMAECQLVYSIGMSIGMKNSGKNT